MTTPEQQAREMLGRMKVEHADYYSAGDLIELANLIAERDALKAELAAIKQGAGEPVAWALWLPGESTPRQLHLSKDASLSAAGRWPEAYQGCVHVPLYTRPCVPLTDEQIDELWRAPTYAEREHYEFARAIETAHGIKGVK